MSSFLDILRTQNRAESILLFWRPVTPKAFGVNARYCRSVLAVLSHSQEFIIGVRMEFTNLRSLSCAWNQWTKPSVPDSAVVRAI
jgi:hypothetical protein